MTRLLKIAAHVLIRCCRIYIRLASAFPLQDPFRLASSGLSPAVFPSAELRPRWNYNCCEKAACDGRLFKVVYPPGK